MSTPCTTCGQPIDALDERCPTCGALASPAVDETASLAAADATRADDVPPWSIPIREPRTAAAPDERPDRRRTAALALLGLVVLAATVVLGGRVLDGDDAGTASGDTATTDPVGTDESGGIDGDAVRAETTTSTTDTTAAPTTTETTAPATATTAAPTTTAAPSTTTTAYAARTGPNGTGSVPALSTRFRGWLAQLTSVPYDAGTDGLADEWQRVRGSVPGAVAARSDDWAAFRDGFWVLVDPGPFASADDVRSFCASTGLGDDGCLARELRG